MAVNNIKMDLRVAFQGGGARISELIAAAYALKEIHLDEEFPNVKVSMVSGTSAGSIAAALFYTNAAFENIVEERVRLSDSLKKNFKKFRQNKFWVIATILLNRPIYSESSMENLLHDLFDVVDVEDPENAIKTFRDTALCDDIYILAADLKNGRTGEHDTNSSKGLIEALIDSAAIPFVFRLANKKTSNAHIVDGGIFENLPFQVLTSEGDDDTLHMAFSFSNDKKGGGRVRFKAKEYALFILSKIIDKGVGDAKLFYKDEAIINLPNSRSTLDFYSIFDGDFDINFPDLKNSIKKRILATITTPGIKKVDWNSDRPLDVIRKNRHMSEKANHFVEYLKVGETYVVDELIVRAEANSLEDSNFPDVHFTSMTFKGEENVGLQFIRTTLYASEEGKLAFPDLTLELKTNSERKWKEVPLIFLPIASIPGRRTLLIIFPEPMKSGFKYRYTKRETVYNSFAAYSRSELDCTAFVFSAGKQITRTKMEISFPNAHLPSEICGINPVEHSSMMGHLFGSTSRANEFARVPVKGTVVVDKSEKVTTYKSRFEKISPDIANYVSLVYKRDSK